MERFEILVKKKIAKQLSEEEAIELWQLWSDDKTCRQIFDAIFSPGTNVEALALKAEEAFALQAAKLGIRK